MTRQYQERMALPGGICLAYAGAERPPAAGQMSGFRPAMLPRRPDAAIINEAIPLFYIGRNRNGLWVARDAEARIGGIFLTRRSALRFAKESSEPGGCATMFVAGPLELDPDAPERKLAQRMTLIETAFGGLVGAVGKLFRYLRQAVASLHVHRSAIERELFKDCYALCSKNDDDLPIVR